MFNKQATETWDAIVDLFKDNHQLSKWYSKNLSYMLQKQRQCLNSYSTVIRMVVAYPRHRQKNKEVAEQIVIDSGLKTHFPIWGVSACKSYAYLSPEEYIKLLNTHAEGCFVSHIYPRFRAFTDEWESRMTQRQHDDNNDDDTIDGEDDGFPRNKLTRSGKCGVISLANCFNEICYRLERVVRCFRKPKLVLQGENTVAACQLSLKISWA